MISKKIITATIAKLHATGDSKSKLQASILEGRRTEAWVFKTYIKDQQGTEDEYYAAREAAQFLSGKITIEEFMPGVTLEDILPPTPRRTVKESDKYIKVSTKMLSDIIGMIDRLDKKIDRLYAEMGLQAPIKQVDICDKDDLMRQGEATKYIGCSPDTLNKWTRKGLVRCYRKGYYAYYSKSELDENGTVQNHKLIKHQKSCASQQ